MSEQRTAAYEPDPDLFGPILRAYEYASDADTDPWQFALQVSELDTLGMSFTEIRWLLLRKYASLAQEITVPGDATRTFRHLPFTALTHTAYLVLTDEGASEFRCRKLSRLASHTDIEGDGDAESQALRPQWDAGRRELRIDDRIVKRFRVPAPNQELILNAFEEEGWPASIDDPLPPVPHIDCQHRLRATIKSLNRRQSRTMIRFHGNGGGQVIYWDLIPCSTAQEDLKAFREIA